MIIKNKKEEDKLSCPACKSRNILTNKEKERRCRRCGYEWKFK